MSRAKAQITITVLEDGSVNVAAGASDELITQPGLTRLVLLGALDQARIALNVDAKQESSPIIKPDSMPLPFKAS